MIDRTQIGKAREPVSIRLEASMIRLFAQAIGETNEVYSSDEAARAAGLQGVPMPPTFLFCLGSMADPNAVAHMQSIGVRLDRILHGEQEVRIERPIFAGERLTFTNRLVDIHDKSEGKLTFILQETSVDDESGQHVGALVSTFVVRN